MRLRSKSLPLFLIALLAVSSLGFMIVKPANAQTIPVPSVPQFTIKYVDDSYYVPITTTVSSTTNPYTNKTTTTTNKSGGYYVENKTIQLWVKNQQYSFSNGTTNFNLYYDVQVKGHFGQNWTDLYPIIMLNSGPFKVTEVYSENNYTVVYPKSNYLTFSTPIQSNSDYTVISLSGSYTAGDQIDYQVKAIVGHVSQYYLGYPVGPFIYDNYYAPAIAYDADSGWSNTQTITITASSVSPSPSPTFSIQELLALAIVSLLFSIIAIAAIVRHRKRAKTKQEPFLQPKTTLWG